MQHFSQKRHFCDQKKTQKIVVKSLKDLLRHNKLDFLDKWFLGQVSNGS